jgi:hypothetical protein
MRRLLIVAPLVPGAHEEAVELLAAGPPFDPQKTRFTRHAAYISDQEALFAFEGDDVEWEVDDLVSSIFHPAVNDAVAAWKPLLAASPRPVPEVYFWQRGGEPRRGAAYE